ncbi:MAG: Ktr system potassium uptake protein B [Actinobacteria bacterium ADurb.Bin346]|nr:MAG: Ktr system potassium uptake protein B [Actinobacteria bacterium ADurb.Bin346]
MKEIPVISSKTQRLIGFQVMAAFAGAILTGALILMIPHMTVSGSIRFVDALFTSTSAICVTGLIVQDTAKYFTDLGKSVILILIQLGGLGIMTVGSIFGLILGKKIQIKDKFYIDSSFGPRQPFRASRFFGIIAVTTAVIELTGTFVMFLLFHFKYAYPLKTSFLYGLFHSVSAFNNAGFALYSNNLEGLVSDAVANLNIMLLIIIGGIGFPVISEIISYRKTRKLSLHAKVVFLVTFILIFGGALVFWLFEFKNPQTLAAKPFVTQVLSSFFQVVTARTAGFNTLQIGKLTQFTLFFLTILMFIGASPGGTGGGIKTTTFAVVTAGSLSALRGRNQVVLFRKKLPDGVFQRALTVTFAAMVLIVVSTIGVLLLEKCSLTEAIFEVTSAFGTVGLSTGITFGLTAGSKVILILCMYIGRIGISTLALALAMRTSADRLFHIEENMTIG